MIGRPGRLIYSLALAFLLAFAVGGGGPLLAAQKENKAGLVIQFADGSSRTYCVAFEGESISGVDLLLKTGLPVKIEGHGGMGALVCKIDADGCDYPGEACACKSYGPGGVYWSYHHLREGKFKVSSQGASSYRVKPGEVDGWAWSAGKAPAASTFGQICAVGSAPATPTIMKAAPSPTRPAQATATQKPAATAIATRAPVSTATAKRASATARPKSPTPPRRTSTRTATLAPKSTATVGRAGEEGEVSGAAMLERGVSLVVEAALRDISRVE